MFVDRNDMEQSISVRIRYHVQKEKISQPKLAKAIGCSRDTIFAYMNNKTPESRMDINVLKKLADYFGVDKYYFCNAYHIFTDTEDVPRILKRLREKEGVTQKVFAYMLEIPLDSYKSYEQGKAQLPERHWRKIYYLHKWDIGCLNTDEMDKFESIRSNMNMNKYKFQGRKKSAKIANARMKSV